MYYAPVIIPTLNRKKHLERCLNSLANNTGAQNTHVIISVDYPPSVKYVDGYNNVKDYLTHTEKIKTAFKELTVIYQDINLGPEGNCKFLKEFVGKKSKTYIFTEDDNEFSPNFLIYINSGLIKFENYSEVLGICAYKDTAWEYNGENYTAVKLFPGYGVGLWKEKDKLCEDRIKRLLLGNFREIRENIRTLYKKSKSLCAIYVNDILMERNKPYWVDNELCMIDTTRSIYMHLTNAVCIVSSESKSRTYGNDGSGVNMAAIDMNGYLQNHLLDHQSDFKYSGDKVDFLLCNYQIGDRYIKTVLNKKYFMKFWVSMILLKLSRYDYNKASQYMYKLKKAVQK